MLLTSWGQRSELEAASHGTELGNFQSLKDGNGEGGGGLSPEAGYRGGKMLVCKRSRSLPHSRVLPTARGQESLLWQDGKDSCALEEK